MRIVTDKRRASGLRHRFGWTISAIVALSGSALLGWGVVDSIQQLQADERAESALAHASEEHEEAKQANDQRLAREAAARSAEAERKAQEKEEASFAADGWETEGGSVYYQWSSPEDYSCGYWDCAGLAIFAVDGCPTSLYVEAAITSGGTKVGLTNELTTSLAPYEPVAMLLEDHTSMGDGFEITKVNCY